MYIVWHFVLKWLLPFLCWFSRGLPGESRLMWQSAEMSKSKFWWYSLSPMSQGFPALTVQSNSWWVAKDAKFSFISPHTPCLCSGSNYFPQKICWSTYPLVPTNMIFCMWNRVFLDIIRVPIRWGHTGVRWTLAPMWLAFWWGEETQGGTCTERIVCR